MSRSLRALSHRTYLFVWLGSLLSNIGNWMENVGQGWVVASVTHSPFLVELVSFAQFLPVIFLAIPAGILADKYDRKRVLIVAQIIMCLLAGTLALLAHLNLATPKVIIWFTLLEGSAWAINAPAWQTVIPHLVPRRDLESAIAMNSIQYNLARLAGPALSGFIIYHWSVAAAFTLNALSFIGVIIALMTVKFETHRPSRSSDKNTSQGFSHAWNWVWTHRGARRIILSLVAFAILSAPIQGLMPFFASDVLMIGPKGLGILLACLGAGAVTGAYLLGFLPLLYPRHHLIPLSMVGLGLFSILYSQSPLVSFSYPLLFVAGIFWLWTLVSCNTAMQILVPDKIRGRVMSILLVSHVGMLPFGHLLAGTLSKLIGPRETIFIAAILMMITGFITLWKRVPEIDGLNRSA